MLSPKRSKASLDIRVPVVLVIIFGIFQGGCTKDLDTFGFFEGDYPPGDCSGTSYTRITPLAGCAIEHTVCNNGPAQLASIKIEGESQQVISVSADGSFAFYETPEGVSYLLSLETGRKIAVDADGDLKDDHNHLFLYHCSGNYLYFINYNKGLALLIRPATTRFALVYIESPRPFLFLDGECKNIESREVFNKHAYFAEIIPETLTDDSLSIKVRSFPDGDKESERTVTIGFD